MIKKSKKKVKKINNTIVRYEVKNINGVFYIYDNQKEILENKPFMTEEGCLVHLNKRKENV